MLHLCRCPPAQQQALLQLHRSRPLGPCSLRPGCPRVEGRTGAWRAIKVWHELTGALGTTAAVQAHMAVVVEPLVPFCCRGPGAAHPSRGLQCEDTVWRQGGRQDRRLAGAAAGRRHSKCEPSWRSHLPPCRLLCAALAADHHPIQCSAARCRGELAAEVAAGRACRAVGGRGRACALPALANTNKEVTS